MSRVMAIIAVLLVSATAYGDVVIHVSDINAASWTPTFYSEEGPDGVTRNFFKFYIILDELTAGRYYGGIGVAVVLSGPGTSQLSFNNQYSYIPESEEDPVDWHPARKTGPQWNTYIGGSNQYAFRASSYSEDSNSGTFEGGDVDPRSVGQPAYTTFFIGRPDAKVGTVSTGLVAAVMIFEWDGNPINAPIYARVIGDGGHGTEPYVLHGATSGGLVQGKEFATVTGNSDNDGKGVLVNIPEPATAGLVAFGLFWLVVRRRSA